MKEGIASALGGLDYSWVDPDSDFFTDEYGRKIGSPGQGLWDPFTKGYDKKGNPIKWTDDDIRNVFMRGEFGFPNYPTISQGGGGGGYAQDDFTPRGNPNEAWGAQNPLQQAMISLHGGQGFQQGFRRGGIVGLVA